MFDGADLASAPPETLRELRGRSIAMIFQEPMTALNPVMRVGEQIAEAPLVRLGLQPAPRAERALELMRLVGIPDPERARRRVPARAVGRHAPARDDRDRALGEPKLILCDEPTTALDVTIQDQILKLLASLREELGVSIVFVSHDLAVIAQTCQRVAVMYAGQVVETGHRRRRSSASRGIRTRSACCARCPTSTTSATCSRRSRARRPTSPTPPSGCRFHPRCAFAQADCVEGAFPLRAARRRPRDRVHPPRGCAAADVRREPVIAGG